MAWTAESIIAEFKTHLAYWQEKLRLRDLAVRVMVCDEISSDQNAWCSVTADNGGANPYAVLLRIRRGYFESTTRHEVWRTVAHELVHVMNWCMAHAFEPLTDWFSTSQLNLAKTLMRRGNEELAYKWEDILATWFAADAPPDEVPE